MRWVQQAALYPHRCAVLPYVGNSSTTKGFLDTGIDVDDIYRIYLSGEFFDHVIPQMGFVPQGTIAGLEAQIDQLNAKVAEIEVERDEVKSQLAAVQVLKQAGYTAARKPGRPPGKTKGKVTANGG